MFNYGKQLNINMYPGGTGDKGSACELEDAFSLHLRVHIGSGTHSVLLK